MEKNVLVSQKKIQDENLQKLNFEITRTFYSYNERSEQSLKQNTF